MSDSESEKEEETCMGRYITMTIALISLIMAVVSYSAAARAYKTLNEVSEDYNFLLDHWQRKPITDIQLVAPNAACPTGYEDGALSRDGNDAQRVGGWLGTTDYCDARSQGYPITVTEYRCECNSDNSQYETSWSTNYPSCSRTGCHRETRTNTYTFYTQAGACNSTQTSAGCATDPGVPEVALSSWRGKKLCYQRGGWQAMNRPTVADGCPGGVVCGNGTYQSDNTICAPSHSECPITDLGDLQAAATGNTQLDMANGSYGAAVAGLPINQVWMVMNQPCWHGTQGYPGRDNVSPRVRNLFDVGCEDIDTRFEEWDTLPESTLYTENNVPNTGGQQMGGRNGYPYQNAPVFDYKIYSQYTWRYVFMREQYWDPDCDLGLMDRVEGYENDIKTVKGYQKTLLTLNGIFTLGFTIIYVIFVFMHNCDDNLDSDWIPGHGAEEQANIDKGQTCVTIVAIICRFIPLILCLGVSKAMEAWMNKAKVSDCSRPAEGITDQVIRNAGKEMEAVYDANVQVLIFDILNALFIILPVIYRCFCKGEKEEKEGDDTKGGDDMEMAYHEEQPATYSAQVQPQQGYMPYQQQATPMYTNDPNVDANNDGIPDMYQHGLPAHIECRLDPNSGKPYWVDHQNQSSTWVDPRTTQQFQQQQVVPQYGAAASMDQGAANAQDVPEQYKYNLPANYEARKDPSSGRIYWVDHNTQQSTWVDPRQNMAQSAPYNPQAMNNPYM